MDLDGDEFDNYNLSDGVLDSSGCIWPATYTKTLLVLLTSITTSYDREPYFLIIQASDAFGQ